MEKPLNRVGHYQDPEALRGCTVVRFPKGGATAGIDVRGSAPGTRETDLLSPINLVDKIHAIVFAGGSAFGLDAAGGVMSCLAEEGEGYRVQTGVNIPIVPAAVIYDLGIGDSSKKPDFSWGYKACKEASSEPVKEGNVGAGLGATVGKTGGMERAMKGGLGTLCLSLKSGVKVAALVIVNAIGDIFDPSSGQIIVGARGHTRGKFLNSGDYLRVREPSIEAGLTNTMTNTTLGIVATNAPFNKTELTKIAQMAQDGLARAIRPVHTMNDGDLVFAVSVPDPTASNHPSASINEVGSAAAEVITQAILSAVRNAESIRNIPAYKDW